MMPLLRLLPASLLLIGALAHAASDVGPDDLPPSLEDAPFVVHEAQGRVDALEEGPVLIVDGLRYAFAPGARVEFLDGYGAPTLIPPGMVVWLYYDQSRSGPVAGTIHVAREIEEGSYEGQ